MSLLSLLALAAAAGEPPPLPGSADVRPPLDDPLAAALRPMLPATATVRVGPSRTYPTLSLGLERAAQLRDSSLNAAGLAGTWAATDPATLRQRLNHRVDVLVDPGLYDEDHLFELGIPGLVAIYAADGQPGSIQLNQGIASGGWNYIEGLAITPPKLGGSKYAVHHTNLGTSIFSRCGFDTRDRTGGSGGDTPFGMDGAYLNGREAETIFYDCAFQGGTQTNLHGADVGDPDIIAYIGCSFPGGNLQYSGGGNLAEVWGVDCVAGSVNGYGDFTDTYLSGCTLETPSSTADEERRDWPVPYGGLSAYWRSTLGFPAYPGPDLRT